jgi:hypothetical protein
MHYTVGIEILVPGASLNRGYFKIFMLLYNS